MANRHRELSPRAFRVFGPKMLAMRREFEDEALESRFLTGEMGQRALSASIPIALPNSLAAEALGLRNKLLRWRLEMRHTINPFPDRIRPELTPRLNQTALALLSLIDSEAVREEVAVALGAQSELFRSSKRLTLEELLLSALARELRERPAGGLAVGTVTKRLNEALHGTEWTARSSKWVGWYLRVRLSLPTEKSHGVFVVPESHYERIRFLVARARFEVGSPDDGTPKEC